MSCDTQNVIKGRQLVLLARNDGDTAYEIIGGVRTRGYTFDNPVEETTSSSTTGEYGEAEWTGYSNCSMSLSGVADTRTGAVDPVTGLTVVGYARLLELATQGVRAGQFRMLNVDTDGYIDGCFNITSFGSSGDTPGLLSFDASLENKSDVIVVGAP